MKWDFAFRPKWVDPLTNDWRRDAWQDAAAGVAAGNAALPRAGAVAFVAGLQPQAGPATP